MTQKNPTPLPLTGGSEKVQTAFIIDWIAVTFKRGVVPSFPPELSTKSVEVKAFNAYNQAERYEDGRIVLRHSEREEMGVHVIFSGETLRNIPISPRDLLAYLVKVGGTVKRLDCALDAFKSGMRVQTLTAAIKRGKGRFRAKETPFWADPKTGGYTQYIGKKSSEVYARVYDKAIEQGVAGDWKRAEVVFQGDKAHPAALALLKGASIASLITGVVDFPTVRQWRAIIEAEPVEIHVKRKDGATLVWLLQSAAPSLARLMYLDGNDESFHRFVSTVFDELNILKNENGTLHRDEKAG